MLCGAPFAVAYQPPELSRDAALKSSAPGQGRPACAVNVAESPGQSSGGVAVAITGGGMTGTTATTALDE